ncbi:hypothetical protein [Massilia phosphatilytica]
MHVTILSCYLAYFAWRLLAMGVVRHAIGVGLALVAAQAVAVLYDFVTLPGDEEHLFFYTLAAPVWSLLCAGDDITRIARWSAPSRTVSGTTTAGKRRGARSENETPARAKRECNALGPFNIFPCGNRVR